MAQNTEYTEYRKKTTSEDTPFSQPIFDFSETLIGSPFLATTQIFNNFINNFITFKINVARFKIYNNSWH